MHFIAVVLFYLNFHAILTNHILFLVDQTLSQCRQDLWYSGFFLKMNCINVGFFVHTLLFYVIFILYILLELLLAIDYATKRIEGNFALESLEYIGLYPSV